MAPWWIPCSSAHAIRSFIRRPSCCAPALSFAVRPHLGGWSAGGWMKGRAVGEACGFGGRRWLSGQKREDAIELPMPKLVPSMKSGMLLKWLVKEGDEVNAGDLVCEIQVENLNEELKVATMLIETWENGYIAKLIAVENSRVDVDTAIAVLCDEEKSIPEFSRYQPTPGPSPNSGTGSMGGGGRVFCWQAYVKGPPIPGMG